MGVRRQNSWWRVLKFAAVATVVTVASAACGDGVADPDEFELGYDVSATVGGLESGELVLSNDGEDTVTIDEPGTHLLWEGLEDGADYEVVVESEPAGHGCEIDNGTGTIQGGDVDDILVDCYLLDEAEFNVDVDMQASQLTGVEGDTITVAASVTNVGDLTGERTISFSLDDGVHDQQQLELDGGQTDTIAFAWVTADGDAGTYEATVDTGDHSEEVTITVDEDVPEGPVFEVAVDESESTLEVDAGDTIEVEATVENSGDETGSDQVELVVGGDVVDTREVEDLEENDTETIRLEWETGEDDGGTYQAEVVTSDDSDEVEVTVVALTEEFAVEIDTTESVLEVDAGDTVEVEAEVENIGAETGSGDIEFLIGDEVGATESIDELDPDETETFKFVWETDTDDIGSHSAIVTTGDDEDTAPVLVFDPDADASVGGRIAHTDTDEPMDGVDIVLFEQGETDEYDRVTTGEAGDYLFVDIDTGDYELLLEAPGLEPNYDIGEIDDLGGGDGVLELEVTQGQQTQDLNVDWLHRLDFIVDGGMFDLQPDVDDSPLSMELPGCQQENGSWEPEEVDVGGDEIEIGYNPEECFSIEGVGVDLATGELNATIDNIAFPDIEIHFDDSDDEIHELVDEVDVDVQWLFDDVSGEVDFFDGSLYLDIDLRILVGGTAHAEVLVPIEVDFGARDGDNDCQFTGGWGGGDFDNAIEDENDEQIGDYLHDSIELRLTTDATGIDGAEGDAYDPDTGVFVTVDNGFEIDRLSEGAYGRDDDGGPACGELSLADEDFAAAFNDLADLPAQEGDLLGEFEFLLPW